MTDSRKNPDILDQHYLKTLENFALISSENLHFLGYFENQDDTLITALRNLNHLFAAKACLSSEDLVLDVGCGSGGPACYMAETVGCRVVGIDIGKQQLARARQLAQEKHLTHLVKFSHQNATHTSFDSKLYDVVLMIGCASHIPSKEALFAECARLIKKEGRLIFGDAIMANPEWFYDRKNSVKLKVIDLFFGNPLLESLKGYLSLLQSCGFQIAEVQKLSQHVLRSFELWTITLEEKRSEFIEYLGKSRYRGLLKAVKILRETVYDGHFDAVIITARIR